MNTEGNTISHQRFAFNITKSASLLHKHFSWIIDSGANDHMCSNKSFLVSLHKLPSPHLIGLPDGQTTFISFIGDIQLHETILLKGVLYVPSFKYNLLSVAKLTKQLHTFLLFTDHACMMQDPSLKHKLALSVLGTKLNDLYVFDHNYIQSHLSYSFSVFNVQT